MRVSFGSLLVVAVVGASVGAATPLLPPRDYKEAVVAITGDEAVALQTATAAMQRHLEKAPGRPSISAYYATIEKQAPSFWRVVWALNDASARGGAVEFSLDATGTKVVAVKPVE